MTPLWGYSATSQSGQRRNCARRGLSPESGNRRFPTLFERARKMLKTGNKNVIKDLNVWSLHINEISKCDGRMVNFIVSINIKIILIQLLI